MAGRGNKKKSLKDLNQKWNVAIYARRSFDDTEEQESNTIINQKDMLKDYINELENASLYDFYIDDGYSGTDFNRPGFKRLFTDIVNGNINAILVKDLSRLGRNYTKVGEYIEDIFPMYGVRIISVNDNIDSFKNPESVSSLIVPIKNLINDEYARDISNKVKSAYKTMAKGGKFISGTTPYGYAIDPEDKHHLVINEQEAEIVREVFKMALDGAGKIKITKYLNNKGILCRKELQRRKKQKLTLKPFAIDSVYLWGTTTIGRMLQNETYIGNLVQCKTTNISYKNHKSVDVKEEDWIRVENTHDPIISKDMFYKVQKGIKERTYERRETTNESIYNRILICADCGKAMIKQEDFRGNRVLSNYFCKSYLHLGKSCSQHKIKTDVLDNMILEAIKQQIRLVVDLDKAIDKLNIKGQLVALEEEYNNKKTLLDKKLNDLKSKKRKTYENWKFDKISKDEYLNVSESINLEIDNINNEYLINENNHKENLFRKSKDDSWIEHYKRNRKIKKVTKKVLKELVEKVIVYENQSIKVVFKYRDSFEECLNLLKSEVSPND